VRLLMPTAASRAKTQSDQRRLQALSAARSEFSRGGYESLSIEAVARAAGVSRTWLYSVYPDRKALLIGLIALDIDDFVGRLTDSLEPALDIGQMLLESYKHFLEFVSERREAYLMLFGHAGLLEPEVAALLDALRERLAALYVGVYRSSLEAQGVLWPTDAEARLHAHAMIVLAEGSAQAWLNTPTVSQEQLVQVVVPMMLRVLLGPKRTGDRG
jgi:AcrR family transcriptional regulator